ncbi:uncharacterized protein LOC130803989 isoform X2 [Amaranthus tricolor]|uniref:uncharacterized protein LOC130803989 isoform X2 n=1 Tax=Amaranthus tricolor TaxID=29722 RepID=UPI002586701C|nr:uncharacterized protein LOC130803989 isoform X2 [Amaranthus tricolor]
MGDEKDAFYVVRKGDIIGIYKSSADCQAQAAASPLDPSISVYKGYGLSKDAESYLVSRGLQQAGFSISACDMQDGLFGHLSVCPIQDPGEVSFSAHDAPYQPVKLENYVETQASIGRASGNPPNGRIPKHDAGESSCSMLNAPTKPIKLENYVENQASLSPALLAPKGRIQKHHDTGLNKIPTTLLHDCGKLENYVKPVDQMRPSCESCTIEFDGASKGNPGQAGAGAILRARDGNDVWLLREGVGIATNNVAEYRSVILGMKTALQKGFKHVKVRGDSMLVCNQIQGKWKTKNENMASLCKDALQLKTQFLSFTIEHVPRELNSAADAQANRAIRLKDGQVEVEMAKSRA